MVDSIGQLIDAYRSAQRKGMGLQASKGLVGTGLTAHVEKHAALIIIWGHASVDRVQGIATESSAQGKGKRR